MDSYCVQDECFLIGKKKLQITTSDISLIFGFPMQGKNIFPLPKISFQGTPEICQEFVLRNFGQIDHITRDIIIQKIKKVLDNEIQEEENDLPKFMIILSLITFFFPDNQRMLSWGYLQYAVDLKKMNKVSWPITIHYSLIKALNFFKLKPRNMSGCSMIPLVSKIILPSTII